MDGSGARRDASAAIFGNRYMAEVLATIDGIADDEGVTVRRIARELNIGDSVVRPILSRLLEAGYVEALPKIGGSRSAQYYVVTDRPVNRTLAAYVRSMISDEMMDGKQYRSRDNVTVLGSRRDAEPDVPR
jgi:DNA-binding transcriptional ArsR family regulator